jgi:hypothetical protein
MKRTTLTIATVILSLLFTTTAFGGKRQRQTSRTIKPAPGSQICTGCCDPCYEDDVAKIKSRNASARKAKPTRSKPQPR